MTDSSVLGAGWWIQSAKVSDAQLTLTTGKAPLEADFQVSLIRVYVENGVIVKYLVADTLTEEPSEGANIVAPNYVILVVSSVTRKGFVDYTFWAKSTPIGRGGGRMVLSEGSQTMPIWVSRTDGSNVWVEGH